MRTLLAGLVLFLTACGSAAPGAVTCAGPVPAPVVAQTGDCSWSVLTDRATYTAGQKIVVTARTTATGPNCAVGVPCGSPAVNILDSGGKLVWRPVQMGIACPALARLLKPGEFIESQAGWESPNLPSGVYSATGNQASVHFRVC